MTTTTRFGGLTSDDLCDRAGVTYRQLDYWVRLGLVETIGPPRPGHGQLRRYRPVEARVCCAVARLRDVECPEPVLRHVAPFLRAMPREEWHGILLVARSGAVHRFNYGQPVSFGESGWLVNLDLCANRAG